MGADKEAKKAAKAAALVETPARCTSSTATTPGATARSRALGASSPGRFAAPPPGVLRAKAARGGFMRGAGFDPGIVTSIQN